MLKASSRTSLLLLLAMSAGPNTAHAATYTVKQGDSFSSISASQLNDASRWREIWSLNPQIRTPTQLKAGEQLRLPDNRNTTPLRATNLMPDPVSAPDPIQVMALDLIRGNHIQRLRKDYRLLDNQQLEQLPRIHAYRSEQGGQYIYAHRFNDTGMEGRPFGLFRASPEPAGNNFTELTRIGSADLVLQDGDKARLKVMENRQGTLDNILLLPLEPEAINLTPNYPPHATQARILKALYEHVGGYRLILNQGAAAGLQPGHLLRFNKPTDTDSESMAGGWAIVIDTSRDASLALVISARQVPSAGDILR